MKIDWKLFVGGREMFWISILVFVIAIIVFAFTYICDLTSFLTGDVQSVDETEISQISRAYVSNLGISVDTDVVYRFIRYRDKGFKADPEDCILLGTFHEWNNKFYIDISVDLYKGATLSSVVIHETRHMLVQYMKNEKIIDLTKYTEEIAEGKTHYYNQLFDSGIILLKNSQEDD